MANTKKSNRMNDTANSIADIDVALSAPSLAKRIPVWLWPNKLVKKSPEPRGAEETPAPMSDNPLILLAMI